MAEYSWDSWNFEYLEVDLRDHCRENDLAYDPKHPLSCLAPDAAKNALAALGVGYDRIAELGSSAYSTVAGWFNAKRQPSRGTVMQNIYPALCEAYVRGNNPHSMRFLLEQWGLVESDAEPSPAYQKSVAKHVFAALTTGSAQTEEEIKNEVDRYLLFYRRAIIRYAASQLKGEELADLAHTALGMIMRHAARPSSKQGYHDDIASFLKEHPWQLWADSEAETDVLPKTLTLKGGQEVEPTKADLLFWAGAQIGRKADTEHIQDMSYEELEYYIDYLADYRDYLDHEDEVAEMQAEEYERQMAEEQAAGESAQEETSPDDSEE